MIDSHPALNAASPQAPVADWFIGDDLNHNGAFFLSQNFDFFYRFAQRAEDPLHEELKTFNFPTPDGYDFFLRMGPLGYQSDAQRSLAVSYNSLRSYVGSLHHALTEPYPQYDAIGIIDASQGQGGGGAGAWPDRG